MSFISAWIVLPLELLMGIICGWYLRTLTWEARSHSAAGKNSPNSKRDGHLKLLSEIREGILRHAQSVKAFSRSLQSDASRVDVPRISEENAEFEQELNAQIRKLHETTGSADSVDVDLNERLDDYRMLVEEFGTSLAEIPDDVPLKSMAGYFAEPLSALLTSQQVLQQELQEARNRLLEQNAELQSAQAEARHDPLTNIPNRRAFEEEFAHMERKFLDHGSISSLVVIDVDQFKQFNDTYGHAAGDAVLSIVAHVLQSVARDTDMAFRIGGEEFAMLLPGRDAVQAHALAERFRDRMEAACLRFDGEDLQVTISAGVATFAPGVAREQLAKNADTALYAAKATGRNCVISHGDGVDLAEDSESEPEVRVPQMSGASEN